jgi:signal transduction histidine kinase
MAASIASRRAGEREAIVDTRSEALVKAQRFVEPVVTDDLLTGDPAAVSKVGDVVEHDVLDDQLVRVKIWTREGTIVYSDRHELQNTTYPLGISEVQALDRGQVQADVSDASKPENRWERGQGKLLEVYLPISTPSGKRLLFEAYFRYDRVVHSGSRVWRTFAPVTLGALIALELVQVPLAWSLARRLRQRQREREGLLQRALDASDLERRRIASDLHDGVVQDLAGVAYGLSGAARSPELGHDAEGLLDRSAGHVRESIKALRSLLVEIYPPNLYEEGLENALGDLLARANGQDLETSLDTSGLRDQLPTAVAGLLHRVAQEGIRNVLKHAQASAVSIGVSSSNGSAVLEVVDDGIGFDAGSTDQNPRTGHFGLQGLSGLVADAGGHLEVRSAPGAGTRLHVEVPLI